MNFQVIGKHDESSVALLDETVTIHSPFEHPRRMSVNKQFSETDQFIHLVLSIVRAPISEWRLHPYLMRPEAFARTWSETR